MRRGLCWIIVAMAMVANAAFAQDRGPDQAAPEMESVHDPYQGMDADGRIPEIDKSLYVDRPERWRYVPEGRIDPGNLFERFLVSSFIVPIVFRSADVGTGFGLALTDIDFRKQRRREFLGGFFSYTTEGQQSYVLRWRRWLRHVDVPGGGVLQEERSFVRAGGGYRKTLTRRFFGIGPSTRHRDESSYTDEVGFVDIGLAQSLPGAFDDFVLEVGLLGEAHWLGRGYVGGEAITEQAYPGLFDEADRIGLGWLGMGLRWDTRDSQRNPYRGSAIGAKIAAIYTLFGDHIFTMPPLFHEGGSEHEEHPPTDSLAFHLENKMSSGNLPFFARPTLGGTELLRGYIAGRWRDDAYWASALEYRFWVIPRGFTIWRHIRVERLGAALFYELGAVADDEYGIFHERVRQSYGVSARATIERAALFRADFGFSDEGLNFSAGFGLSF
jgi:hypothetical protein